MRLGAWSLLIKHCSEGLHPNKAWQPQLLTAPIHVSAIAGGAAKGDRGLAHMQLDGEPWAQAIPSGSSQPLVVS